MPTPAEIAAAKAYHRRRGHPERAVDIARLEAANKPIPLALLSTSGVTPAKEIEDVTDLNPPPRFGKGSSHSAWVGFAKKVSDIEPAVLKAMSRDGIINALVKDGIIAEDQDDGDE